MAQLFWAILERRAQLARRARGGEELNDARASTSSRMPCKTATLDGRRSCRLEVILTTDRNLRYQQNLTGRKIAVVTLGKGRWTVIKPHVARIVAAINAATPGSCRGRDTGIEPLTSSLAPLGTPAAIGPLLRVLWTLRRRPLRSPPHCTPADRAQSNRDVPAGFDTPAST